MIVIDAIIFSLQKYGGISTYFKNLIQILDSENTKSAVFVYEPDVKIASKRFIFQNKRILERIRPIEIVNKEKSTTLLHSSYYRFSKSKQVKNVITVYDFIYEKFEKNIIKKYIHTIQKSIAVKHSSAIICISESTKKDFLDFYPNYDPNKIFVTHLAHSTKSVEFENDFDFDNKFLKPYCLFVGMRSFHKNFNSCVLALKDLEIELKIVGGGDLNKKELALLETTIPGRYQHLKNVDNAALNKYYEKAICLLYPSIYEGFGLPILEAMANGCAVITTNASSIPEVAGDAAILLENPSPSFIKNSIISLMDSNFNKSLIRKGFRNCDKFSWDITIKKTIEIYNQILDNDFC
jgi:mannosyltransferase